MKIFLFLLGTSFFLAACSPDGGQDSADTRESITRGRKVRSSDELSKTVVAIVSELPNGQALCTGTLLSDHQVLTAAHCVDDKPSRIEIAFSPNVSTATQDSLRLATGVYQNPYWVQPTEDKRGDLAIIEFAGGIPQGYFAVKLATKSFQLDQGEQTIFLGYGVTNGQTHAGAGTLRMTSSKVLGAKSLTEVITDGSKTSVCFGDSGGPAFVVNNGEYIQWGVASSVSNQSCNDTSVHTAVMQYLTWIHEIMRNK